MIDQVFEKKVIAGLFRDYEFCTAASKYVKKDYFDLAINKNMSRIAIDYFARYNSVISKDAFGWVLNDYLKARKIRSEEIPAYVAEYKALMSVDMSDKDYVLEKMIDFVKHSELKIFVGDAVQKYLPKEDFDKAFEDMYRILAISPSPEPGAYAYYENFQERQERRSNYEKFRHNIIPSGIDELDSVLRGGGFAKKELVNIIAGTKRGKSMALLHFASVAAKLGKNVAYFSLETGNEVLSDRLDASNLDIPIDHLILPSAQDYSLSKEQGEIFFWHWPTKEKTVRDIKRALRQHEIECNIKFDMLITDYADLLKPTTFFKDELAQQKATYEELRGLVVELDLVGLNADQTNRSNAKEGRVTDTGIQGSYGKIQTCDLNITLSATDEEFFNKLLNINIAAGRNTPQMSIKIHTDYSRGRFFDGFVQMNSGG